jgi:hypothetical protein
LRYSDHSGHGIALSRHPGIAGGLRNIIIEFKKIELKTNDNLDCCGLASCQYFTSSPKIAETISNTPWKTKPFPFSMKVFKCTDGGVWSISNVIQRIFVDGEWRRRQFSNSLSTQWGKWINIEKTINDILNNESIQKFLTENWDRYMAIDENDLHKKEWRGSKVTTDEIVEQIKTGTAKIYRNELIKS